MTRTQRDRHQRVLNAGAAFATTPQNLLFCETLLDIRQMAAGDRPGICELSAERGPIRRVAPECTLDDGAGRHINVGRHVSLRPPPISLVYDTAELIGVDVCAWAFFYIRFYE